VLLNNWEAATREKWVMAAGALLDLLVSSVAWQPYCRTVAAMAQIEHQSATAPDAHIYTWIGNTPDLNRKLHVSGYRMGCDDGDPHGCVLEATEAVEREGLTRVFLSMPLDADRTLDDAREYSRLSVSYPFIAEVGFDDFVARYRKLFFRSRIDSPSWLRGVIRNIKADNAHLSFGITLYEDELDSTYLHAPQLPNDVAQSVDYVHLFLHYRTDAPQLVEYVESAQALFPRARVIVGLYAYDRVDYIQCAPTNQQPCTPAGEIRLYREAVTIAGHLLRDGSIVGIEFYPGFFGKEKEWRGWTYADYCSPKRVKECIENTRMMREDTVTILSAEFGW
jgi:hypothetical protein